MNLPDGVTPGRLLAAAAVLVPAIVVLALVLSALPSDSSTTPSPRSPASSAVRVSIGSRTMSRPIGTGFVGLSLEYSSVLPYAGTDPAALNPVFVQLLKNLDPGQSPVLRIGGASTDRTWYPVSGITPVPGIRYTLTSQWMAVMKALAHAVNARLVLGINMEANSTTIAAGEANAFVSGLGTGPIRALELGNEPELYGAFPWYQSPPGHGVKGRPDGYGPADFTREASALAPALPSVPLAGPATGGPKWLAYLPQFVAAVPQIKLVTVHRYGTRGCFVGAKSPAFHSIANLLSSHATTQLADSIAPYTKFHPRTRVDELGSVNCGGYTGVSDTFAAGLWAVDVMFELARVGAAGVNFHTFPGAKYEPFAFTQSGGSWTASVKPAYYGMQLFAQAAVPGSKILSGSGSAGDGIHVWALKAPDGSRRVVVLNYGAERSVAVRIAGATKSASVLRLSAPSLRAKSGVTLGGQSYGAATSTGRLPPPHTTALAPSSGSYVVQVPAGAALLTIPA